MVFMCKAAFKMFFSLLCHSCRLLQLVNEDCIHTIEICFLIYFFRPYLHSDRKVDKLKNIGSYIRHQLREDGLGYLKKNHLFIVSFNLFRWLVFTNRILRPLWVRNFNEFSWFEFIYCGSFLLVALPQHWN